MSWSLSLEMSVAVYSAEMILIICSGSEAGKKMKYEKKRKEEKEKKRKEYRKRACAKVQRTGGWAFGKIYSSVL